MAETKGGWPAFSMPLLEPMETVGSSAYMVFWSLIKVIAIPFQNFVFALAARVPQPQGMSTWGLAEVKATAA